MSRYLMPACRLFTEAWIETWEIGDLTAKESSRLFTEAWIETRDVAEIEQDYKVASSRRRGLKLKNYDKAAIVPKSPLHGGVD